MILPNKAIRVKTTENEESEKLDDSVNSQSNKSISVSVHEEDEHPQSMSEDQLEPSHPDIPVI